MKPPIFHRMFGYNLDMLPNPQLAVLEKNVTSIEEACKKTGATIGYPGWGVIYHLLLAHLDRSKEEIIIETGTNWGCSTIVLAQALVDASCKGRVITFELESDNAVKATSNLTAAGLIDRVELHLGDSRQNLPKVLQGVSGIRAVFLDASHLYDDVKQEFDIVLPKLAEDALVFFDNTYRIAEDGEDQRVNGFLRNITSEYGGNLINLEFASWYTPGVAIWQKKAML